MLAIEQMSLVKQKHYNPLLAKQQAMRVQR
jgi:hypothetical protein